MSRLSEIHCVVLNIFLFTSFSYAYAGCLVGAGCRVFVQRLGYMCNKKRYNLLVLLGSQFPKRQNFWNFGKIIIFAYTA